MDVAEVGAHLAVADVVPVAERRGVELAEQLLHLGLGWNGVEGRQVLQSEAEIQVLEFGKQIVERLSQCVEEFRDVAVA